MLKELQSYYQAHGISAVGFRCKHHAECARSSPGTFTTAKETFVSSGYEAHSLPRILFLSLDSGSASHDPAEKTLASVRQQEEIDCQVLALPRNKHWFRTHELAYTLLRSFSPGLRLEDAKRYFAHANSAKCCQNNPQRAQASEILFANCREYIPGEITILAPDVLITQGDHARRAVEGGFPTADLARALPGWAEIPEEVQLLSIGGRAVIWIHTYHPRNPNSKQNRDRYGVYEKLVYEFMTRRPLEIQAQTLPLKPVAINQLQTTIKGTAEPMRVIQESSALGREEALAEGDYIYLDNPPDTPIPSSGDVLVKTDCAGFAYMTMAQFCKIAEVQKKGGSRACNAFGGDRGKCKVASDRKTRAAWVGRKLRKYVLVSAAEQYFRENGIRW